MAENATKLRITHPPADELIEVTQLEAANIFSIGEKYLRPHAKASGARLRRGNRVNYDLAKLAPYMVELDPERWGDLDYIDALDRVRAEQKPGHVADADPAEPIAEPPAANGHDGRDGHDRKDDTEGVTVTTGATDPVTDGHDGHDGRKEGSRRSRPAQSEPMFQAETVATVVDHREDLASIEKGLQLISMAIERRDGEARQTALQLCSDTERIMEVLADRLAEGERRRRQMRRWVTVLAIVGCLAIGAAAVGGVWAWRTDALAQERADEAAALADDKADLIAQRDNLNDTIAGLSADLAAVRAELSTVTTVATDATEKTVILTQTQARLESALAEARRHNDILSQRVAAMAERLLTVTEKESGPAKKDLLPASGNGNVTPETQAN